MKIVNLTPHEIKIVSEDGTVAATFPSQGIARATQTAKVIGKLNGIEIVSMEFGKPENLPEFTDGIYYVVSVITANAAKATGREMSDLLITADPVRDEAGRIIGCRRFATIA